MFVTTPPQISAEAAQTGFIGPSVPATAGSDGGFAAWLLGGVQPQGDARPGQVTRQGNDGIVPSPIISLLATELASGSGGPSNQNMSGASGTTGFQKGTGTSAELLLQTSVLNQTGVQSEAKTNQVAGQITDQQNAASAGIKDGLNSAQKQGATGPQIQSNAVTAETVLNRLGASELAKQVTDPLAKQAVSSSSVAADRISASNRGNTELFPQAQSQMSTLPQSTDSGFRPQVSQTGVSQGLAQASGQDGAGKPNPTINSSDIAVQMARNKANGNNQFTIRLTPESMGTITVKLNITNNANLTAQLQVEKPETLALLQKDLAGLEKALKAQGFSTGDGDLSIALKTSSLGIRGGEAAMNSGADQRFGQGQNMGQNTGQNQSQTQAQSSTQNQAGFQNQATGSAAQAASPQSTPPGGLDRPAPGMLLSSGDMGFQQSHQERGAQGHDGFEQNSDGYVQPEPEELDSGQLEQADLIANAYHGRNLLIGMSTQLDLSV